jgi:hypothetical protein
MTRAWQCVDMPRKNLISATADNSLVSPLKVIRKSIKNLKKIKVKCNKRKGEKWTSDKN